MKWYYRIINTCINTFILNLFIKFNKTHKIWQCNDTILNYQVMSWQNVRMQNDKMTKQLYTIYSIVSITKFDTRIDLILPSK